MVGCGDSINGGCEHVSSGQHQEGKPYGEEEGGKSDGGFEGQEPEDEGEDKPALL